MCTFFVNILNKLDTFSHLGAVAGVEAEAAAVRVVGAAEGFLGDGKCSRAVVAVHAIPDHLSPGNIVTVLMRDMEPGRMGWRGGAGGRGSGANGVEGCTFFINRCNYIAFSRASPKVIYRYDVV